MGYTMEKQTPCSTCSAGKLVVDSLDTLTLLIAKMSLYSDMCVWCAVSDLGLLGHFF